MEQYNQIVNDWWVKLRSHFINTVLKAYPSLRIEDVEDIYTEAFIAVRDNMLSGRVAADTSWKSYIFRIGLNMAANTMKRQEKKVQAIVSPIADDDDDVDAHERFQTQLSLLDIINDDAEEEQMLENRLEVMRREIRYLPEPCETILKDFYYGKFSMAEIMAEIHYNSIDSVKSMKNRCLNRFRERMRMAFKMLNFV